MDNYGIYYSFSKEKESLLILFSLEDVTYQKSLGRVIVSYHDIDVVSYRIKDINKIIKIHADGLIPMLNDELLSIINNVLIKDGLTPLKNKKHSGFYNAKVISTSPLKVKTIDGEYNIKGQYDVKLNDHVVMVKKGTFLFDKSQAKKDYLCSLKDLEIANSDELLIDDELDINEDFFSTSGD